MSTPTDHNNTTLARLAAKFSRDGFAVLCVDIEGHGLSDGLHVSLADLASVYQDVGEYFLSQLTRHEFNQKPFFIYGGVAVVYVCVHVSICV